MVGEVILALVRVFIHVLTRAVVFDYFINRLNFLLLRILRTLWKNGFCRSPEESESVQGEQENSSSPQSLMDGTGFGEGIGNTDVSNEIESEEQLLGLAGQGDKARDDLLPQEQAETTETDEKPGTKNDNEVDEYQGQVQALDSKQPESSMEQTKNDSGIEMEQDFTGGLFNNNDGALPESDGESNLEDHKMEDVLNRFEKFENDDMSVINEKPLSDDDDDEMNNNDQEAFEDGAPMEGEACEDELRAASDDESSSSDFKNKKMEKMESSDNLNE